MNQEKYIGMDVHQATISVAVMDSSGKLIMECILETKASHWILEFVDGLRGSLSVTFEEGTSAAWLHDLLKPHVSRLSGLRPAKERAAERRQQERPDRCAQAGGVVTRQPAPSGVPRRARGAHIKGVGSQLPNAHPRCQPSHDPDQSSLSKQWAIPCSGTTGMPRDIGQSGWPRSRSPGFACGQNVSISNWICCNRYDKKRGGIY